MNINKINPSTLKITDMRFADIDGAPKRCTLMKLYANQGLVGWRYDSRCNYMITLVTEPRASVFGILREWGVERTEAGRAVYDAWHAIGAKFRRVRATYNAIMPDHFHGIVFIMEEGDVSLDVVVEFFAGEVERRIGRRVWNPLWRDSVCLAKGQLHRQLNYALTNAKRRWIKENNPGLFRKVMGFRHWRLDRAGETLAVVPDADGWDFREFSRDGGGAGDDRELWEVETGEEIAKPRKGNKVQRAFEEQQAYNSKSPVSGGLASTAAQPGLAQPAAQPAAQPGIAAAQSCCRTLAVRPLAWTAMGNPFLLDAPLLVSVRISTATPPDKIGELAASFSRAQLASKRL